ncbi:MAG TPA: ABC transporter substrate-binding protein [Pseudolabrys sp.]|nr:ABC transporter substrate-binding protein [Pseudolabrys sp.]
MRFFKSLFLAAAVLSSSTFMASAQQQLRVGFIPVMGAAQVFVAEGEGWFKQAGLTLQTSAFESGPNMIQALSSGTLDVYVAGLAPILVARSKGIDVRVVAATVVEEMGFAAGPALAPFFEGRKPADAFKAFREKNNRRAKLATQPIGSGPNTSLQHWLWEVANVDKADVEIVEMGIDATQRALATGAVEGGSVREPAWAILQKQSPNIKLIATGKDMFPNFPGVVVAVLGSFADKNPKAVDDLVRGIVRATALLKDKPDQAVKHIGAAFGKGLVADDILLAALKSPQTQFTSDPRRIVESTAKLQAYQVKIGALQKAESLDGLFAQAVYDRAIAGN